MIFFVGFVFDLILSRAFIADYTEYLFLVKAIWWLIYMLNPCHLDSYGSFLIAKQGN